MRKKKTAKKTALEEIPEHIQHFMKSNHYKYKFNVIDMKTQTLEALTQDVKARNSFFLFVKHNNNAVFRKKIIPN